MKKKCIPFDPAFYFLRIYLKAVIKEDIKKVLKTMMLAIMPLYVTANFRKHSKSQHK